MEIPMFMGLLWNVSIKIIFPQKTTRKIMKTIFVDMHNRQSKTVISKRN